MQKCGTSRFMSIVHIFQFVDSIPKSAAGKILKKELRDDFQRSAKARASAVVQGRMRFQHRRCSSSHNSLLDCYDYQSTCTLKGYPLHPVHSSQHFALKPHKAIQPIPMVFNGVFQYSTVFYRVQKCSIVCKSVQQCSIVFNSVQKCSIVFNSTKHNVEIEK